MKKLVSLIVIILILFIIFIIFYNAPKNYEIKYKIDDFTIIETYNKEQKYYNFNIENKNYKFNFIKEIKYSPKRKLITNLKITKEDKYFCILPIIEKENIYPLCYDDKKLVSFSLIDNEKIQKLYPTNNEETLKKYKDLNIYNFDQTFIIWTYKGFEIINKDEQKYLPIFDQDVYNINLATIVNDYLIMPNYEEKYKFDTMYVINLKNGKKDTWKLDNEINFDSYILGSKDKSVYLFDRKEKIEYELVPHKKKMRKVTKNSIGKIFDLKWQEISTTKLATKDYQFNFFLKYEYKYENNKIYFKNVDNNNYTEATKKLDSAKFIYQKNDTLYYLVKDILYSFSPYTGVKRLMQYFEWNFNNNNMIFIYNPLT